MDQAIAVAAAVQRITAESEARIGGQLAGHGRVVPQDWAVCIGEAQHRVVATRENGAIAVTDAQGRRRVVASATGNRASRCSAAPSMRRR